MLNGGFSRVRRALIAVGCAVLVGVLSGCASTGNTRDPLEPLNRAVFGFNDGFDQIIAKPVAEGYKNVIPGPVRTGVTNFFSNLEDIWILANNVLQGKFVSAMDDFARVFINSSFGILGLIDIASDAGIEKHNEDFGQTLGRWGIDSGPYLVLPFLGSSTVRDALGYAIVDSKADLVVRNEHVPTRNSLFATRTVNLRANLLDASRLVEEAALDKYSFIRDAYLQRRRSLVFDGDPPPETSSAESVANAAEADSGVDGSQGSSQAVAAEGTVSIPNVVVSSPVLSLTN